MSNKKTLGLAIIISAPSGCGKTTIVDRLLKRYPDWVRSISATTRKARLGEKEGEDYFFVAATQFEKMIKAGELLEYATVHEERYGTPKSFVFKHLEDGHNVILAIDVQGMAKVKKALDGQYPLLTLFILPPSLKILRERLEGRKTESPQEIEKRLKVAEEEIKQANLYDKAVVNQNLEETILEIDALVKSFQKKPRR